MQPPAPCSNHQCVYIDRCDGLVNGVQGTVTGFIEAHPQQGSVPPAAVLIKFDSEKVGARRKMKLKKSASDSVPIEIEEACFTVGTYSAQEVTRKQFPLTLCYASTIQNVQGLSLDTIVVTFDKFFSRRTYIRSPKQIQKFGRAVSTQLRQTVYKGKERCHNRDFTFKGKTTPHRLCHSPSRRPASYHLSAKHITVITCSILRL